MSPFLLATPLESSPETNTARTNGNFLIIFAMKVAILQRYSANCSLRDRFSVQLALARSNEKVATLMTYESSKRRGLARTCNLRGTC